MERDDFAPAKTLLDDLRIFMALLVVDNDNSFRGGRIIV